MPAAFDRTRRYRYSLTRIWDDPRPRLAVVGLNPSTADAHHDDPTVRRCLGFARAWGFGALEVVNLYAWRATDPRALRRAHDPVGPGNARSLRRAAARADLVLLAWGSRAAGDPHAARTARRLLATAPCACLGLTKHGHPRHPLYTPRATPPIPLTPARATPPSRPPTRLFCPR